MSYSTDILAQSHDRYAEVALIDPGSGSIVQELNRHSAGGAALGPVRGHYARVGDQLAVMYRYDGTLWLRLGECLRRIDGGESEVAWKSNGSEARLALLDGGDEVMSVTYRPDQPIPGDPTPFVEAEHFDFGLFAANVLADAGRRARIYTPESD